MKSLKQHWFTYLISAIALILFIYPVLWLFVSSLKSTRDIYNSTWSFFTKLSFDNMITAWQMANLSTAFKNSIIITISSTILIIIVSIFASFAFSNYQFKGKKIIYFMLISAIMIPLETLVVPLFIILVRYKMLNSYFGVILPYAAVGIPFSTLVLSEFFKDIPTELRDAAKIDGCTDFRYLIRVVIPLSGPAITGIAVFQGSLVWNEFIIALTILQSSKLFTIPLALASFSKRLTTDWSLVFATVTLSMLPIILLYFLLQRSFVSGMTVGAVKG